MSAKATDVHCPRCINPTMLDQTWGGVPLKICMRCGANFFHSGDLGAWEGRSADFPVAAERAARRRPARIMCPSCGGKMEHVEFPLDPPLEIDRCLSCHGILLDFEEIRRVPQVAAWVSPQRSA